MIRFLSGLVFCVLASVTIGQVPIPIEWQKTSLGWPLTLNYSPDRRQLAVSGDGGVHLVTLATGNQQCLTTAVTYPSGAIFSPDGRKLVIAGNDRYMARAEVWDANLGVWLRGLAVQSSGLSFSIAAFSGDGKYLAVTGADARGLTVQLFETVNFQPIRSFSVKTSRIRSLVFSPDNSTLAIAGNDPKQAILEIHRVSDGSLFRLVTDSGSVSFHSVSYTPDGATIADISDRLVSYALEIRNAKTGNLSRVLPTTDTYLNDAAFSPDGKRLVSCSWTNISLGSVDVWSMPAGKLVASLPVPIGSVLFNLVWSHDGTRLVGAGMNEIHNAAPIRIWNMATYRLDSELSTSNASYHSSVAYSPNGKEIVAGMSDPSISSYPYHVGRWNAATGESLPGFMTAATGGVNTLAFTSDGKHLAVGGFFGVTNVKQTGVLEFWEAASGKLISQLQTNLVWDVKSICFSSDGKSMAVGGNSTEWGGTIEIWDVATLKRTNSFAVPAGDVRAIAWLKDNRNIAAVGAYGYTPEFAIFDAVSGNLVKSFAPWAYSVDSVAVSPDGKTIVTGGNIIGLVSTGGMPYPRNYGILQIWDVPTMSLRFTEPAMFNPPIDGPLPAVTIPSHGDFVFSRGIAYDLSTGLRVFTASNFGWQDGMAFSPDGAHFATVSGDLIVATNPLYTSGLLARLMVEPSSLKGGATTSGTISLSSPAPVGGCIVGIACDSSAVVLPASVTIPAGLKAGTFTIQTHSVIVSTKAILKATLADTTVTAGLRIN